MSFIKTDDKIKLYYETVGKGEPIILQKSPTMKHNTAKKELGAI